MTYQFDFSSLPDALPALGEGMLLSLQITLVAVVVGIAWGIMLALMRLSRFKSLAWFAAGYVNLFRSIPLVMVLLWFFLIVPQFLQTLFELEPSTDLRFTSALVAFSLFEAAYYSEIIRAGIQSVAKGQLAAAYALGLNYFQAMRLIILPQALRNMVPLLLTQGIILFQDTSLVYVSALSDFFGTAYSIGERDGHLVELLLFAGLVYFIICFGASSLVKWLQRTRKVVK